MAGRDAFGQGPGEVLDRIFRVQGAEWGRDSKLTGTYLIHCMAFAAVRGNECQPPLSARVQRMGWDAE
jgi:hypothetical protein